MRIRRAMIVVLSTSLALVAMAGPAHAGGQPTPPPDWMGVAVVAVSVPLVAFFVWVVVVGISPRRRRR